MHPVTKKVKDQVDSILSEKGISESDLSSGTRSMLQDKYDDVDNWMAHKPDWVSNDNITPHITEKSSGSMLS